MESFNYDKVITHIHPAMQYKEWTHRDVMELAAKIGVNPQTVAGVIMGTILPSDVVAQHLKREVEDHIVNDLMDNYDPLRYFEIIPSEAVAGVAKKLSVLPKYLAAHLEKGDIIKLDTDDWLKVSSVKVLKREVIVYSGGMPAFTCNVKDHVVAVKDSPYTSFREYRKEDLSWSPKKKEIISKEGRRALLDKIRKEIKTGQ